LATLGVAKKADVIARTFGHIRNMNSKADMFALIAGKSFPRVDFLQLAEYLENHTDIDSVKQHEK
jgi:hypothetical protein